METKCPRFSGCRAPICPLDKEWPRRKYYKGESVCPYLTELSKPNGRAILDGCLAKDLIDLILGSYPEIITRWTPIKKQLERSAGNPSRLGRRTGLRNTSEGRREKLSVRGHPAD